MSKPMLVSAGNVMPQIFISWRKLSPIVVLRRILVTDSNERIADRIMRGSNASIGWKSRGLSNPMLTPRNEAMSMEF